ncbi:hypothetical protein HYS96_03800, partial [Candidatus Daviesbacteria bacterium]|nr:hypothetical protein [Candidatus Daviesbacteria bacterium]
MKKFILLIILVISFLFFLSPAANAQTREECDKIRASASYNCLTGWSKCYYPCVDQTKDVKACGDTCTQAENACNNQVDADYKACLAAIPKSKVDSPATAVKENTKPSASETKQENSQSPDCRKIFDKESYKCLGVSGDCQRKCGEETKRPDGGAYFNS